MISLLVFFMRQMQKSPGWSDDQRREMKLSVLYRLAGPGGAEAELLRADVRRVLYEMVTEGTVAVTGEQRFRAR